MNIFGEEQIKNHVLEVLSKGPLAAVDLIDQIRNIRLGTTKQAVYLALRGLLKEELIVKYRKKVMLNQIWLNRLNDFIEQTDKNYTFGKKRGNNLSEIDWMEEGNKITYNFNNFYSQDIFYSHLFSLIIKKADSRSPVYIYNSHEWFIFFREKNEKYLIEWLKTKGKYAYLTIGHGTILDREFVKEYSSEEFPIAIDEKTSFPENYYVNVIGNYIAETMMDDDLAEKIDSIYENSKTKDETEEQIKILLKHKYKIKTIISYNSQKASKLRSKLKKNFFIPKELKNL